MAFPIHDVTLPAVLAGTSNGNLPPRILVSTPGQAGGPTVVLVEPAARAWRAFCAAAKAAGHILKATGGADSYRPYAVQNVIHLARYTRTVHPTWRTQRCGNVTWYQRPGTATAACPGTSNHGKGLAVDVGEESDGDSGVESIDTATLNWMLAHEMAYGFSHELQSEPWHIRYWAGDKIPAAVLAYERSLTQQEEKPMRFRFDESIAGADTDHVYLTDGLRYRILPGSYQIDALHTAGGASPVVTVKKPSVPAAWNFQQILAALCGTPDPGELPELLEAEAGP